MCMCMWHVQPPPVVVGVGDAARSRSIAGRPRRVTWHWRSSRSQRRRRLSARHSSSSRRRSLSARHGCQCSASTLLHPSYLATVPLPRHAPPLDTHRYAFHLILAGYRYISCAQRRHAVRAYAAALRVYSCKGWSHVEDHVHFTLGRNCSQLGKVRRPPLPARPLPYQGPASATARTSSTLGGTSPSHPSVHTHRSSSRSPTSYACCATHASRRRGSRPSCASSAPSCAPTRSTPTSRRSPCLGSPLVHSACCSTITTSPRARSQRSAAPIEPAGRRWPPMTTDDR